MAPSRPIADELPSSTTGAPDWVVLKLAFTVLLFL
jgi:hypothetical protein